MKKLVLCAAIALFTTSIISAQNAKFGIAAGYTNITERAKFEELTVSSSESGFYIGALVDITVSEKFHVEPKMLYANAAETGFLYIPVLAKYYVAEKFNLQAGPQANFILDEVVDGFNSFGLDLSFGLGYEINEHFFLDARYSFELTNRYTDNDFNVSDKVNTLNVGLGYKF